MTLESTLVIPNALEDTTLIAQRVRIAAQGPAKRQAFAFVVMLVGI